MKKFLFFLLVAICTLSYKYFTEPHFNIGDKEIAAVNNNTDLRQLNFELNEIKDNIILTTGASESYLLDDEKIQEYRNNVR